MMAFCGYGFCGDGNSLHPTPTDVENIVTTEIGNAQFDNLYVTKNTTDDYTTTRPTDWDVDTIMLANFEGQLNAGNIAFAVTELSGLKIKRRVVGEYQWLTIYDKTVSSLEDLTFVFNDYINVHNTEYEYAWVPVFGDVEGNYVTKEIMSQFDGVFITDMNTIYKFYAGVEYAGGAQVQKVGVFEPFGKQYPTYITNSQTNYARGGVKGTVVGDYLTTGELNRDEIAQARKNLVQFLTNKKAKFIKDYNQNYNLVMVVGNPTTSYNNNWSMGIMDVNFVWSEIGDGASGSDLNAVGFVPPQQ